jgi:hypothetical protein
MAVRKRYEQDVVDLVVAGWKDGTAAVYIRGIEEGSRTDSC